MLQFLAGNISDPLFVVVKQTEFGKQISVRRRFDVSIEQQQIGTVTVTELNHIIAVVTAVEYRSLHIHTGVEGVGKNDGSGRLFFRTPVDLLFAHLGTFDKPVPHLGCIVAVTGIVVFSGQSTIHTINLPGGGMVAAAFAESVN